MTRWDDFAADDAEFYICTDLGPGGGDQAKQEFFARGERDTERRLAAVDDLLPDHDVAIEIGCGVGRLALAHARRFAEVRGVDVSAGMLERLAGYAASFDITNVRGFLPDEAWDEPAGSADYLYSYLVFQHIPDWVAIERYLARGYGALKPGGVARLQFDTRPNTLPVRLRRFVPDLLLPRTQRRAIRRIRRDPARVRAALTRLGFDILDEEGAGTELHGFTARRPA